MGDFIALRVLNLPHNALEGHIPPSLGSLSIVESFDLSFNELSREMPQQLASLTSLAFLNLSYNHLQGYILQGSQFATFEKYSYGGGNDGLRGFPVLKGYGNDRVSETNYTGSTVDDQESNSEFWSDFWKAALMGYGSGLCIGLSIIYFMISTGNPKWLARIIKELEYKITVRRRKKQESERDLRSNLLQGSLPIPPSTTEIFFISQNNLSREIPSSICNLTPLQILNLARNNLRGEIQRCLGNLTALELLNMRHNNLFGNLPTTFINESSLRSLNLLDNKLEEKIPRPLANCKKLQVLDLANKNLIDTFPMWLGTLPKLQVLSLRSNKFHGPIQPSEDETIFPELRIIDLSYNEFSGNFPMSLFQHMKP
ncbi:receptor-like protein Cf-9 [Capsicum annuum]|uniref:receptor-like protein Cf-9 n=1 Tax=Capsicum annuum TaxID=4072 RepID=UPI001FB0A84B|nr:receptor-like protein Cf-9 [Capsicum annuum]